jgi:hypothetical protein
MVADHPSDKRLRSAFKDWTLNKITSTPEHRRTVLMLEKTGKLKSRTVVAAPNVKGAAYSAERDEFNSGYDAPSCFERFHINLQVKPLPFSLPTEFMRRMQRWFNQDLDSVKLFAFAFPTALAFTGEEEIFISLPLTVCGEFEKLQHVMVHEFAHVVQKRFGRHLLHHNSLPPNEVTRLEHEAEEAAFAFLARKKCPFLSADGAATLRTWGPAGHFYTVYWVSRMSGVSDSTAERLAFYAQMPDQVIDLDAAQQGFAWARSALYPGGSIRDRKVGGETRFDNSIYHIQAGLHCLNHREYKAESARREAILRKLPNDLFRDFSFGLGLHALGDSYAHRNDNGRTFMAPFGHAGAGSSLDERLLKLGTEIDNISKHADRYVEYCSHMFSVVGDCYSAWSPEDRHRTLPELGMKISKICEKTNEPQQIQVIKSFSAGRRGSYAPELHEPMPWADFCTRYPSFTASWMLGKAQALADSWTLAPL